MRESNFTVCFRKLTIVAVLIATGVLGGCAGGTHQSTSSTSNGTGSTSTSGTTPSTPAAVLSVSNQSLSFGDVMVGAATSQLISVTNTGSSNLKVSTVSVSGQGYSVSGGSNVTLTPNQSVTISVNFGPSTSGYTGGTLSVMSNASNPVVQVGVSGTGVTTQQAGRTVTLSWKPSSSKVVGYFVYRGTVSGGPYTKLNPTADTQASFTDPGLTSGTYYYVVTSVDSNNVESGYSNEVQVIIP
jgi:hypothetical protein